jgi:hypothetical protein
MALFGRKKKATEPQPPPASPPAPASPPPVAGSWPFHPVWSGRSLKLPAPPHAEHAAELAAAFQSVQSDETGALDYSPASLTNVDRMLDEIGRQAGSDAVAEFIYCAGCYLGEVLVRHHGYRWLDLPDDVAQMFGFRMAVISPTGGYANPIGKTFKRVENGPEDDVAFFTQAEIADEQRRRAAAAE